MGAEEVTTICEGVLEKKVDHRRLPIGPTWKQKYCVLNSDALQIYRSKSKMTNGCLALRTVPLCHIKDVAKLCEDQGSKTFYFNVFTEQGEVLTFRCKDDVGWVAQIQIQLIHYKNRQDILRYKQLSTRMVAAQNAWQRLRITSPNNIELKKAMEKNSEKSVPKDCISVVLPNYKNGGIGIGITVVPHHDGRVLVNRLLQGGPAIQLGLIKPRDQIVSVNGLRVTSVGMLSEVVQNSSKTVSLVIRQRSSLMSSPIMDDPKRLLKQKELYQPDYVNTKPYTDVKTIFEKGKVE